MMQKYLCNYVCMIDVFHNMSFVVYYNDNCTRVKPDASLVVTSYTFLPHVFSKFLSIFVSLTFSKKNLERTPSAN